MNLAQQKNGSNLRSLKSWDIPAAPLVAEFSFKFMKANYCMFLAGFTLLNPNFRSLVRWHGNLRSWYSIYVQIRFFTSTGFGPYNSTKITKNKQKTPYKQQTEQSPDRISNCIWAQKMLYMVILSFPQSATVLQLSFSFPSHAPTPCHSLDHASCMWHKYLSKVRCGINMGLTHRVICAALPIKSSSMLQLAAAGLKQWLECWHSLLILKHTSWRKCNFGSSGKWGKKSFWAAAASYT